MTLLAIDTSSQRPSVALHHNGKTVDGSAMDGSFDNDHIGRIVKSLLKESGVEFKQLSRILVGVGPGSFTGVRIGVTYAAGLCSALNIPLATFNSLEAAANNQAEFYGKIIALRKANGQQFLGVVYEKGVGETCPVFKSETLVDLEDLSTVISSSKDQQKLVLHDPEHEAAVKLDGVAGVAFGSLPASSSRGMIKFLLNQPAQSSVLQGEFLAGQIGQIGVQYLTSLGVKTIEERAQG